MSTLMSKDLNIERSSTRLHAPPGGKSSISFGDYVPAHTQEQQPQQQQQQQPAVVPKINISNIMNNQNAPEITTQRMIKPSSQAAMGGSAMSNIFSDENAPPAPTRRARQPPGGYSSLVIG